MNRLIGRDRLVMLVIGVLLAMTVYREVATQQTNADLVERLGQVEELLDFQVSRAERADCIAGVQRRWFVAVAVALVTDPSDPATADPARAELLASTEALVGAAEACES